MDMQKMGKGKHSQRYCKGTEYYSWIFDGWR